MPARRLTPLPILLTGVLTLTACGGERPDNVGMLNGTLSPCPATPNCVHTGLRHPDGTRGVYANWTIIQAELMPEIRSVVEAMPRTTVVEESGYYLHAEVRSRIFRFVDDVEVLIMPDRELIIRSASRVGSGDLGVNAERVEEIRRLLDEAGILR